MTETVIQVMILISFSAQREQSYVMNDMLPDRLKDLVEETEEGIRRACVGYTKIPRVGNSVQQFNVCQPVLRRLISLMLWSNYKRRLCKDVEFVGVITTEDLRKEIHEDDIRDKCRKSQNKDGEAIIADRFLKHLNTISQW